MPLQLRTVAETRRAAAVAIVVATAAAGGGCGGRAFVVDAASATSAAYPATLAAKAGKGHLEWGWQWWRRWPGGSLSRFGRPFEVVAVAATTEMG